MPCSFVNEISYSPIQNLIFTEDVKNVDFSRRTFTKPH